MTEREILMLRRDVVAAMVPSGTRIVLQEGTEVTLSQALGDSYTLEVFGNLVRLDSVDADAIGKVPTSPLDDLPKDATLEEKVWTLLKRVYDPEIPVNIVDLGLVYACQILAIEKTDGEDALQGVAQSVLGEGHLETEQYDVKVIMTLTAPGCGMGPVIAEDVKQKILLLPEVMTAEVEIVFDPPWTQDMMSDAAKLELGML